MGEFVWPPPRGARNTAVAGKVMGVSPIHVDPHLDDPSAQYLWYTFEVRDVGGTVWTVRSNPAHRRGDGVYMIGGMKRGKPVETAGAINEWWTSKLSTAAGGQQITPAMMLLVPAVKEGTYVKITGQYVEGNRLQNCTLEVDATKEAFRASLSKTMDEIVAARPADMPVAPPSLGTYDTPRGPLNAQQRQAVDDALDGENIVLTGAAGTGKSEALRCLVRALRNKGRRVAVCASTGIAAVAVGGTTFHSLLGLGACSSREEAAKKLSPDTIDRVKKRLGYIDTIVIDEASMITGDHLDMADWWLSLIVHGGRAVNAQPFGGFKIVLCGDWLQLPPVVTDRDAFKVKRKYAFEAKVWERAGFAEHYLTQCFRQENAEFFKHLCRIRRGQLPDDTRDFFEPSVGRELDEPTRLFPTNREAAALNAKRLMELPGESWFNRCELGGMEVWHRAMVDGCIAEEELELRVGAPVLFLKNNAEMGYVNGDRGKVVGFGNSHVQVRKDSGVEVSVPREEWKMEGSDGALLATLKQYPLKLAYAVTIHKSQGMTLERVHLDLTNTFERAMAYVALSRARSLEGLSLATSLNQNQVRASAKCVNFYRGLRERRRSVVEGAG